MGGQKTVGKIYHEAVEQLKGNYFQHVGVSGMVIAASFLFASLLYFVFIVGYVFFLFAYMMSITSVVGAAAFSNGEPAGFLPALLVPLLIMVAAGILFVIITMVVALIIGIAVGTVQVSVQKAVLLLITGDKLTWQAVWSNFKSNWKRYLGVTAWSSLWVFLWSLLFYVPGIVKMLSYCLAPYLIIEYPGLTVRQALKKSMEMTDGYKGRLFGIIAIQFGFKAGVSVLSSIGLIYAPFAALIVWIMPLTYAMQTIAYLDIKQAAIEKGLLPATSQTAGQDSMPDAAAVAESQ